MSWECFIPAWNTWNNWNQKCGIPIWNNWNTWNDAYLSDARLIGTERLCHTLCPSSSLSDDGAGAWNEKRAKTLAIPTFQPFRGSKGISKTS